MTAPPFVHELLAWSKGKNRESYQPNIADQTSLRIATEFFGVLGITQRVEHVGQTAGTNLELAVEEYLTTELRGAIHHTPVVVTRKEPITRFAQYEHLARLDEMIEADETMTLKATIGTDYLIEPDITVGLEVDPWNSQLLHAAVPCKWTLRSDRAQNIRHEAVTLIRHRRGRLPHITPVTAEPLPTRLASLARGTGEVDAVYHVALDELIEACDSVANQEQREVLEELVGHERLRDLSRLVPTLSI